ncbi:hypothetical protein NKR19_g6534 [Coniochaeta hoffmannii]|uniref:Cora-domain-containing protein n=1 Tax=Coniochaeta hoffmannii TaxID=91930 RepID=A0AA38REN3_9PEZI|nr:hypothetical protein NKR19_g6534 [Coniochaeta hoffmannii]
MHRNVSFGGETIVEQPVMSAPKARKDSRDVVTTDSSNISGSPAKIFEHTRGTRNGDSLGRESTATTPASWQEIEDWLAASVASASQPRRPGFETSSVKILFLNEKRCVKAWKEEVCDITQLHPYLKVTDWTTAHYMTTYCRFPLPVDVEEPSDPGAYDWDFRYSVSHPFDWDMLWAYFPQTRTSVGIMRTWFETYDADFQDMENMVETFPGPTLAHPMMLGLFALQILTNDTMANVREKGNRLFETQKMTGFHTYTHLRSTDVGADDEEDEGEDLATVTREILGAASNMTGWDNAALELAGFARFVVAENARYQDSYFASVNDSDRTLKRLYRYVDEQSLKLLSDLNGAKADAAAWLSTATFLLQGVLNLVSQRDARVNISLAASSNKIALDTKRDSTSMMAIAVVTMFFLPGTFTSSFFALPFFDQFQGVRNFWLYWVTTVPLTVAVLVTYRLWVWYKKPPGKRISDKEKA